MSEGVVDRAALVAALEGLGRESVVAVIEALAGATPWVIWSEQQGMWWRPASCGYTPRFSEAGRYSRAEALVILARANIVGPELNEIAFPDPVLAFGRQTVGAGRLAQFRDELSKLLARAEDLDKREVLDELQIQCEGLSDEIALEDRAVDNPAEGSS